MPRLRQIRRRETSPPRQRRSAARLHLLPHAGPHLHGGRSPARSLVPRAAARSFGQTRDAERLQRLPRRQAGAMGRRRGRAMVRTEARRFSDLCGGVPCGAHRRGRRRHAAGRRRRRRQRAGGGARERALRTRLARLAREYRGSRERALPIPIRWCGSARSTCWKTCRPLRSGRLCRRCSPIPCAASASGRPRCSPRSRPPASRRRDRDRFDAAAREFIAAQRANAERPEARTTLANFLAQRGQTAEAETEYKAALKLSPQYATAAINLADLYRQLGRDTEGESILRAAIAASPRDAAPHHALGLALTRLKQPDAALAEFRRAAELEPGAARYQYVYAVALHSGGRVDEAMTVLKEAPEEPSRRPRDSLGAHLLQPPRRRRHRRARLRRAARGDHAGRPEFGGADPGAAGGDGEGKVRGKNPHRRPPSAPCRGRGRLERLVRRRPLPYAKTEKQGGAKRDAR